MTQSNFFLIIELREEILTLALPGPRILEFIPLKKELCNINSSAAYDQNLTKCRPAITTPALLHVNHEYRQFALRFYQPCFHDYLPNKSFVYMDFNLDTLLVSFSSGFIRLFCGSTGQVPLGSRSYLRLVQNVAMTSSRTMILWNNFDVLKYLTGLRKLTKLSIPIHHLYNASCIKELTDADEKLVKDWAEQAGKKRGAVEHASLEMKSLTMIDFMKEFRWDGTQWH